MWWAWRVCMQPVVGTMAAHQRRAESTTWRAGGVKTPRAGQADCQSPMKALAAGRQVDSAATTPRTRPCAPLVLAPGPLHLWSRLRPSATSASRHQGAALAAAVCHGRHWARALTWADQLGGCSAPSQQQPRRRGGAVPQPAAGRQLRVRRLLRLPLKRARCRPDTAHALHEYRTGTVLSDLTD